MAKLNPLLIDSLTAAANRWELLPCALIAVVKVETDGNGFLPNGNPKILFEGHIFYRELKSRGVDPDAVAKAHPAICYRQWTKKHYKGGIGEYGRLEEAMTINGDAALCSASWGLFQVMGFNWRLCGYKSVQGLVDDAKSIDGQIDMGLRFIKANGLVDALKRKEWSTFARRYNGSGYAANAYDIKLAREYDECLQNLR